MKEIPGILVALAVAVGLVVGLVLVPPAPVAADTAGPRYPSAVSTVSESPYDNTSWTNPDNVKADDGAYATASFAAEADRYTYVLRATNFGFSIPGDATIEGIKVEVETYASASDAVRDALVQLARNGTRVGDNKADEVSFWPTSAAIKGYGGPTDLWNTTWTAAQINAAAFGVHFAARKPESGAGQIGYVDFVRVTVHYTSPGATINPDQAYYNPLDLDGDDVTTTITWSDATEIESVHDGDDFLEEDIDYEVTELNGTATLTILDSYLTGKLLDCGDYVELTINFDEGGPAIFTISVYPVYNTDTDTGYETIQAAINAAGDNHTIIVCPGFYEENLVIDKPLVLQSTDGADVTTIGGDSGLWVIQVTSEGVTIEGFTIDDAIKGIDTEFGGLTVLDNVFDDVTYGVYLNTQQSGLDDDYTMGDILISGNEFNTSNSGVFISLELDFDDTATGLTVTIGDIEIVDANFFNGGAYGVYFYSYLNDLTDATVTVGDVVVSGNSFDDHTSQAIYMDYYDAEYWSGTTVGTFGDLVINNNVITSQESDAYGIHVGDIGYWRYFSDSASLQVGSTYVQGNDIDVDGDGIYVYCQEINDLEDDASVSLGDLFIEGNTVKSNEDGIYVYFDDVGYDMTGSAVFEMGDVRICDNGIDAGGYGIYLEYGEVGYDMTGSAVFEMGDVRICDNGIDAGGYGIHLEYGEVGYELEDDARVTLGNVDISGNHGAGGPGEPMTTSDHGIYVEYNELGAYTYDSAEVTAGDLTIQDNLIDSGECGIYLYYDVGYEMYGDSSVSMGTLDISGNEIEAEEEGVRVDYEYVAYVMYDNSSLEMGTVDISFNEIDAGADGVMVDYYYVAYDMYDNSSLEMGTVDISFNEIDAREDGVLVYYSNVAQYMNYDEDSSAGATMTMGDVSIAENDIGSDGGGIYVSYDNAGYEMHCHASATLPSYSITGNVFSTVFYGVYFESDGNPGYLYDEATIDFGGITVHDNTFNEPARDGSNPMQYGVEINFSSSHHGTHGDSKTLIGNHVITENRFHDLVWDAIYLIYDFDYLDDDSTLEMGALLIQDNVIDGADNGIRVEYSTFSFDDSTLTIGTLDIIDNELTNILSDGIHLVYELTAEDDSTQTVGRALIYDNFLDPVDARDGIYVFVEQETDPGASLELGVLEIDLNVIEEWANGIYLDGVDGAIITNNIIHDNDDGIYLAGCDNITIMHNDILDNSATTSGVHIDSACGENIVINWNNIVGNLGYGMFNDSGQEIDAIHNWWGHPSGPFYDVDNQGGKGDQASDDVVFMPWLMEEDGAETTETNTDFGEDASASTTNVSAEAAGGNAETTVTVGEYLGNPSDVSPGLEAGALFFDVHVGGPDPLPTQLVVDFSCPGDDCTGMLLRWFDGAAWQDVTPQDDNNGEIRAVLNNVDSSPLISQLTGTFFALGGGDGVPQISVVPATKAFGNVMVGASSPAQVFTVNNVGVADLVVGTITITGPNADQFSIQNDLASGQTIAPTGSRTLQVVFSPTSTGAKSATLNIPSNDPDRPSVTVSLSGNGASEVLPPVGGTGYLVNRLVLLAPWLALAAVIAGAAVFARRRLTQS